MAETAAAATASRKKKKTKSRYIARMQNDYSLLAAAAAAAVATKVNWDVSVLRHMNKFLNFALRSPFIDISTHKLYF